MDPNDRLDFLSAQIQSLTREKEAALAALEAAAGLGQFETSYSRLGGPEPILREVAGRCMEFLPLAAVALYLVDEQSHDFVLAHVAGDAPEFDPEREVEALILDHSFAYALAAPKPMFFSAVGGAGRLLLHPMLTPSRARGMFVGCLKAGVRTVSDTALALLTVVVRAGAQALESFELYRHLEAVNRGLERTVTERTSQLRQAYEQVRVILDSIQAGVVVIDPQAHRILDINPAGTAMIGLPREEIVGQACFDCFCPARRGQCPIVDGGRNLDSEERVIRTQDGREIPILKTAVRASLGGRDCIVESFVDISEQKKLAQLREDVDRMTRHDLKAPLVGVINLPDILLQDPSLAPRHRELVSLIKDSGLKMLKMINLSLDLYRMETGSYVLDPRPVNLAEVLGAVTANLGGHIRAKRLTVRFETDGGPGLEGPFWALGEELLYFSLFSNLLKNALEASPEGGAVTVSLQGGAAARVAIHNAGIVPRELRERFFEKYATCGKFGGTGLGTYSAKLIVDNLGGRIGFATGEAEGTTVFMILPRSA